MLYNIRYGTGRGWKFHAPFPFSGFFRRTRHNIGKISTFINEVNPDIVGLIEVDGGSYRHYGENQAECVAKKLGYKFNYNSKYRQGSRTGMIPLMTNQGNSFLTKQKIKSTKLHYFDKGVKRLVVELELEDVVIFLVHLSLFYKNRQRQLANLLKIVETASKPVIVAGDFNMFRGEGEMKDFLDLSGLKNMNTKKQLTYPSKKPAKQLDFMLHSPQIKVNFFKVCKEALFSDHLPLCCEFEVNYS